MQHWIKSHCPQCNSTNWVLDTDNTDLTIPNVEAVKCCKCQQPYWLDEDFSNDFHQATGDIGQRYKDLAELLASNPDCLESGMKEPKL